MKSEILIMLRNTEGYVSGQEMCNKLGVSRTAIWKAINQLKEDGYRIEAVPNKGYSLTLVPDVVSKEEIISRLNTKWIGKTIECFSEIDSTNDEAKRKAQLDYSNGAVFLAEKQTLGRGRRGRSWETLGGDTIALSILLRPNFLPNTAPMLTLVMALSVARAIEEVAGLGPQIKWPNDLVLSSKKICGILTEMNAEIDYIHYIVIGVGVNVNVGAFSDEISDKATSLFLEGNQTINRAQLVASILQWFELYYEKFCETNDLSQLQEEYNKVLINREKNVRILEPNSTWDGIAKGIDSQGELLVETKDGVIHKVFAGEVSVRGLYEYV